MTKYKIIETSLEEHDALHEAGVWVNWIQQPQKFPSNLLLRESYHVNQSYFSEMLRTSSDVRYFTRVECVEE